MKYLVMSVIGLLVSVFMLNDLLASSNTTEHEHTVVVDGKSYTAVCISTNNVDRCTFEKPSE